MATSRGAVDLKRLIQSDLVQFSINKIAGVAVCGSNPIDGGLSEAHGIPMSADAPSLARGPTAEFQLVMSSRRLGAFKGLLPCARFSLARTAVSGQGEKDVASTHVSRKRPGTSRRAEGGALSSVRWTLSLRFRCRRPRRFRS